VAGGGRYTMTLSGKLDDLYNCHSRVGSDFFSFVYWTLALCLWEVNY